MACPSVTSSFPQPFSPDSIDASSSSSSTNKKDHIYDIFINHRGPDVKKGFASHLYNRLLDYRFRVFLDQEELRPGEKLSSQIEEAIATASVHVAIFSPTYAESNWCLDELVLMQKTNTPIIPVFYKVKPAELRWTRGKDEIYANVPRILGWWRRGIDGTLAIILRVLGRWTRGKGGLYEQALLNLERKKTVDPKTNEEKARYEPRTLENWREALFSVSKISGFELEACNGKEGELLRKIVQRVHEKVRKPPLHVATYPTGLVEKVEDLEKRLLPREQQSGKAQVLGIVGVGGIGKTTLALEFFNRNRTYYHASCFMLGVREAAAKDSLESLQSQLLRDLTRCPLHQISNIPQGIEMLKEYLSSSEALVILDDVDSTVQVDALLLPLKGALHPSSLILVTSRNKDVLTFSGIVESYIYHLRGLSRQHSQELFCWYAFNQPQPCEGFEDEVAKCLDSCDGLPLSLKVIGALLHRKELDYWKAQLRKLSNVLPSDIRSTLQISYDSLDDEEKEIFLDIACFFVGDDKDTVIRIWQGSNWEGSLGIANLENKCLVEVDSGNRIKMHDHLRYLGRYLADQKEPGGRPRRVWRPIDNLTLQNELKQSPVRGVSMVQQRFRQWYENPVELQNRSVGDMSSLRLFRAEGECLESIFSGLGYSPDLIWLCLYNYPYSFLHSWLPIKRLRVLQVSGGQPLETLWPSDNEAPLELRELKVQVPLSELPNSIGQLKDLEKLEVRKGSMTSLPNSFHNLTNLQYLDLSWSSKLQALPHSFGHLIRLEHLCLAHCSKLSISEETLGNITTLVSLDLSFCLKLNVLPPQVARQRSLQKLNLLGTNLKELQGDFGKLGRLGTLKLGSPFLKTLPASLGDRTTLTELTLSDCRNLQCLPDSVGMLKQLTKMEIMGLEIQYLPVGVREMNNLEFLKVHSTPLLSLPFLKSVVRRTELLTKTVINKCMVGLKDLELHKTRISQISFVEGICPNLQHLKIEYCNDLEEVGTLPTSPITLDMLFCGALRRIEGLCGLAKLQQLDISRCKQVEELPSLESLTSLEELRAVECKMLKGIRGLSQLPKLQLIDVRECSEIRELTGIQYMRSLKEFLYSGCLKLHAGEEVQENLPVHLPGEESPGQEPSDEEIPACNYTIDNYFGINENDSDFDVGEWFKACDSYYNISGWLKVM